MNLPIIYTLKKCNVANNVRFVKRVKVGVKYAYNFAVPYFYFVVNKIGEYFIIDFKIKLLGYCA